MFQGEKISNLYDASKYLIETVLPQGSWLGKIGFDDDAVILSDLKQIKSDVTRQTLVSFLPDRGAGRTCISCGIDLALDVSYTCRITYKNGLKCLNGIKSQIKICILTTKSMRVKLLINMPRKHETSKEKITDNY